MSNDVTSNMEDYEIGAAEGYLRILISDLRAAGADISPEL